MRPAIAGACLLALALSFVVARTGGEPQARDPVLRVMPETKPADATPSPLGPAADLPALAKARPKPAERKAAPAKPAPPAAVAPAPVEAAPPPEPTYTPTPEPAYIPPAVPVTPAPQPTPTPPEPAPPVYFDDSG